MKTAAIIIEKWKLPTFKKHLDAGKFTFTEHPGPMPDLLTLRAQYEWVADIKPVIEAAQAECRRLRKHN